MQKYEVLCKAGSGNFSDVYKARNRLTDQMVAIKQMKHCQDLEQLTYKELQILANLNHPNIIKTKQIIRQKGDIKVVFEYMDQTLLELYQSSKLGINENQIRCILFQAAFALDYLHGQRFIHRDIKPENLLINRKIGKKSSYSALIKLIDFGLAKQEYLASTDYVATRWYRAPENLLDIKNSSTAMDIFALGCVIVQLFTLNPLFPGDDTLDQLNKVVSILGPPTNQNWPEGYKQAQRKGIVFSPKSPTSVKHCMPTASNQLVNLVQQMLHLNPMRRITARQILNHPFFQKVQRVIPEYIYKQVKKSKQQYEAKKARKVSPLHYSPKHQAHQIGKFQHNKYLNLHTPVKQNEKSRDSKLSIQKRIYKQPSSRVEIKGHNIHKTPQTLNNKNYSPVNNGFNSNTKQICSNLQIHDQITRNKSKDYAYMISNSVQKRSFDNRLHPYVQKSVTLNDERYHNRNTLEIKQPKQDTRLSPRFNVKYFKQPQSNTHKDRKNIGVSLQSSFLSRNRVLGNNVYPLNNFNHRYFKDRF